MAKKLREYVPRHLSDGARDEWRRLMAVLGDRFQESDRSLYADFCQASADVERLTGEVARTGSCYTDHNGNPKTHPVAAQLVVARNQLAALRRDLNLTPRSRMEKAAKVAKRINPLAAMRERHASR